MFELLNFVHRISSRKHLFTRIFFILCYFKIFFLETRKSSQPQTHSFNHQFNKDWMTTNTQDYIQCNRCLRPNSHFFKPISLISSSIWQMKCSAQTRCFLMKQIAVNGIHAIIWYIFFVFNSFFFSFTFTFDEYKLQFILKNKTQILYTHTMLKQRTFNDHSTDE